METFSADFHDQEFKEMCELEWSKILIDHKNSY